MSGGFWGPKNKFASGALGIITGTRKNLVCTNEGLRVGCNTQKTLFRQLLAIQKYKASTVVVFVRNSHG